MNSDTATTSAYDNENENKQAKLRKHADTKEKEKKRREQLLLQIKMKFEELRQCSINDDATVQYGKYFRNTFENNLVPTSELLPKID